MKHKLDPPKIVRQKTKYGTLKNMVDVDGSVFTKDFLVNTCFVMMELEHKRHQNQYRAKMLSPSIRKDRESRFIAIAQIINAFQPLDDAKQKKWEPRKPVIE